MDDEVPHRHQRLLGRLTNLPELPMRQAALRQLIVEVSEAEACWHLGQILRGAVRGSATHADAMLTCALWLIEERDQDNWQLFQRLYQHAHAEQRRALLYLLRDPPPHRALGAEARLPEARLPMDRDVTLGERRALASGPRRRLLERLLMDPDPLVIEKLLDNPALRARDVIVIASRRPTTPALIACITRHTGWMQNHQIREAAARNPYAHTGHALRLLPTLAFDVLRQLDSAKDLHPEVNAFAELLVELRERHLARAQG